MLETLAWWHWLLAGLVILVVDLFAVNTFYLMWIGLGMLPVAVLLVPYPEAPLLAQTMVWALFSCLSIVAWRFLRQPGQGDEGTESLEAMVGSTCVIMHWQDGLGQVRLQRPYGGKDVWAAKSGDEVGKGDTCEIVGVDAMSGLVVLARTKPAEARP